MSENCTHNCGSCNEDCKDRKTDSLRISPGEDSRIKKVYAVVSGKGGVGKSMICSLLASESARNGRKTAILDADITGPSIPKSFGLSSDRAEVKNSRIIPVKTKGGIQVMSLNLITENETDPVIWRGPLIAATVKQFWTDVAWGDVDYMFVDMPPGTGDVPLTVFQSVPVDGIIIVTSPQELVGMIVEKAVNMASMMHIPVLGIVENMAYVACPHCGEKIRVFGESHIEKTADRLGIKNWVSLSVDSRLASCADTGTVEDYECEELKKFYREIFA